VTKAKTHLSQFEQTELVFDRSGIILSAPLSRRNFEDWIADDMAEIQSTMQRALQKAGVLANRIDAVFMTGGTSYVPAVRNLFTQIFGSERIHIGNAFQSVASGLALVARDRAISGL